MAMWRAALQIAVLGLAVSAVQAQRLIVFGDGLADNGAGPSSNGAVLFVRTNTGNSQLAYPPTPYSNNRFTNGQVIPEYLAQYLGLSLYDFAIGGATSGATSSFVTVQNGTTGLPAGYPALPHNINVLSVLGQVQNYVNTTAGHILANDVYCIIVGSNDYYDIIGGANATTADVIANIRQSADTLYGNGVRKLVIAEVPPLQGTPFAVASSNATRTQLTNLVTSHNSQLSTMVNNLTATYPQGTFAILPTYTIVSTIATNPTRYGYSNAGTPCYGTAELRVPTPGATVCASPATHIFWDGLNPTTQVHQQIAAVAAREISFSTGAPATAPAGQAPVPAPAGLLSG